MRRVIFVNRFYWPEENATSQLLADLAEALFDAGHEVIVITSRPGWTALKDRATHRGVLVQRVAGTRWAKHGLPGKAVDFVSFYVSAILRLCFTARRGDAIISLTDPPLLGVGVWLAARLCGARVYHWVQDIYPEVAIRITGQRWLQVLQPLRNLAWRRSDGCVTLGSDMAASVERAGVPAAKITVVPNWAPAGLAVQAPAAAESLRDEWQLGRGFVVAYSGNLGRVHDLEPVLDAAEALRDDDGIVFVFIGSGPQRRRIETEARARKLTRVRFFHAQPRSRLTEVLAVGNVHLVTLLPGCEQFVFPSKLYGAAAVGRPVIFIGPPESEIARLVRDRGIGLAFARTDIAALAAAIRDLRSTPGRLGPLGEAAARFGRDHTGPSRALAAWQGLLAGES